MSIQTLRDKLTGLSRPHAMGPGMAALSRASLEMALAEVDALETQLAEATIRKAELEGLVNVAARQVEECAAGLRLIASERDEANGRAERTEAAIRDVRTAHSELCAERVELFERLADAEARESRLRDEFRMVCIELHIHKHYAATGVRWEDCEDCASVRALLPEYAEQPAESEVKE